MPSLDLEPSDGLPLKNYFQNNTYTVKRASAETYYDFHVPGYHNYLAEGLIHHNSGKSTLLANMARQDMEQGYGVMMIETKGGKESLFYRMLDVVPEHRLKDVIVINLADPTSVCGFNVLQQGDPAVVVDEIGGLINYLYRDTASLWAKDMLYHGLKTLACDPSSTIVDLIPMLRPHPDERAWADDLKRKSYGETEMRKFWQLYDNLTPNEQDRRVEPLKNRIWMLTNRARLRNLIGQSESSFQMGDVIREHKILMVNLEGVEADSAKLAATLLMNAIWHAVKTVEADKPNFLYLDEFEDVLKMPIPLDDMLVKARGFKLGAVLAHQHIHQMPIETRHAVLNNTGTKIYFRAEGEDASVLSRYMKTVSVDDFDAYAAHEGVMRVATPAGVSPPMTFKAESPVSYGTADRALHMSRAQYGRPVHEVEAEIENRRLKAPAQQEGRGPRPTIGEWDNA